MTDPIRKEMKEIVAKFSAEVRDILAVHVNEAVASALKKAGLGVNVNVTTTVDGHEPAKFIDAFAEKFTQMLAAKVEPLIRRIEDLENREGGE